MWCKNLLWTNFKHWIVPDGATIHRKWNYLYQILWITESIFSLFCRLLLAMDVSSQSNRGDSSNMNVCGLCSTAFNSMQPNCSISKLQRRSQYEISGKNSGERWCLPPRPGNNRRSPLVEDMNNTPLLMARGCKRGTKKQERLFIIMRNQQWGQTSPCSFHLSKVLLRRSTSTLDIYFHFLIFPSNECLSGVWNEIEWRKWYCLYSKKKNALNT